MRVGSLATFAAVAGLTADRAHERARLRAAVAEQYAFVWRVLRRFGLTSDEADDATQEAFAVLSRRIGDVTLGAERSFLFQTARLLASTVRRQRARWPAQAAEGELETHPDPRPTPESIAHEEERRRLLDTLLDELPDELRSVIVLCELESVKLSEAANMLEIPVGTVSSRLRRARETLAAKMQRYKRKAES